MQNVMIDFQFNKSMMRYSKFVPQFYNLCKSYGFKPGRIMPSRAFCSDESQGFPIILIAKHFGAFPFNHGMAGGIVATDRHGPHAEHGKDLVIIQASHVGYDPEKKKFGIYRRMQVDPPIHKDSCGKICEVLQWYQQEYDFARKNISFSTMDGQDVVIIDNQFLDTKREQGLFLLLEEMIDIKEGRIHPEPLHVLSTSKMFRMNPAFKTRLSPLSWEQDKRLLIGNRLTPDLFYFKHHISTTIEGRDQLEQNLGRYMAQIVTSDSPPLTAAVANTQIEFDRTYRTLVKEPNYYGKNLAFIAGLNIDISPQKGHVFPRTKFIPWAAYIQTQGGEQVTLEQKEIVRALRAQSTENPDRIELSNAIHRMEDTPEIKIIAPSDVT